MKRREGFLCLARETDMEENVVVNNSYRRNFPFGRVQVCKNRSITTPTKRIRFASIKTLLSFTVCILLYHSFTTVLHTDYDGFSARSVVGKRKM